MATVALVMIFSAIFIKPEKTQTTSTVALAQQEAIETSIPAQQNEHLSNVGTSTPTIKETPEQSLDTSNIQDSIAITVTTPEATPKTQATNNWQQYTIKEGDSLSSIFRRAGVSQALLFDLMNTSPEGKKLLSRIYPGQTLEFDVDETGVLAAINYKRDKFNSTLIKKIGSSYQLSNHTVEPEIRSRYASATISSSLYLAARKSDLPQNLIMELANIFGGVIDFVYDVRSNDSFSVMYEERYVNGEKVGNGAILAAQFVNQGDLYKAYRYRYENGKTAYFNEQGVSMRKPFLRSPVDFNRISSGFNLKRLHPIFKTARPHRGIDYAAPVGTPVFSAGDGRVVASGYTKANGNYVVISHGTQYTTKYLHLHKKAVKKGSRVKQQQIIGWVGSTGYATGPHLHYEFLVNGVHRNPRTILKKLPKAKSIEQAELARFQQQIGSLQNQLAAHQQTNQYASSDNDSSTPTL